MTKNITLSIDEDVLLKVRRVAVEKNTSVNAMVRDYLGRMANSNDRAKQARQKLLNLSEKTSWDPGEGWKWDREALYDRPVLLGHEHSAIRGHEKKK